jgi:hypothetical protein
MSGIHVNPIVRTSQDEMWYRFHNMWPVQVPMTQQMPGTPRADEGVEAAAPVTQVRPKHALAVGQVPRVLQPGVRVAPHAVEGLKPPCGHIPDACGERCCIAGRAGNM